MVMFAYKAITPDGRHVRGEMDAANLVDLEMRLKRMDLDFINGNTLKGARAWHNAPIPRRELINFCFHLEQLTRAGVPILEGLADLRDSTEHARFREVVAGLVESIEGGRNLSDAAEDYPHVFDTVFCALLRAGETSGQLPRVLREIMESIKREDELAAFGRRVVIYPIIVSTIILAALAVALLFLVPQLGSLFRLAGQTLPLQTRLLIGASELLADWWWLLLLVVAATATGLRLAIQRSPSAKRSWDGLMLALPLIGPIRSKIILARFAGLFSMMYGAGIPIVNALKSAETVAGNTLVADALSRVRDRIAEGHSVSSAFAATPLFPPLVVRMLRVGENTGALDTALANVNYFYDRDVREAVDRLQAIIEPLLMVVLGAILLGIMMAVLGPVYDIITQLPL
ncbi:type II secretion system F family protein [Denitromonas ohlonensis]|uniref:Type II secretion system F family protein n=3 Tax=Zoogloeaceae TaxID=2008794 RepID=A0A558CG78_9RHOO|nr:type II secretion system F family protein [Denitromonas halophila]TVO62458.1 type II secretion system F family protein [Denitromonas ohlonensis]TVO72313.1 type II secretion system F family protein [Denitromonas ohlonensis]TVT47773.1 MAG: type II secretion system F family protein [Denitromonas halophila]TVT67542.1 MAG: type II secretion system F family protein [Denitromonas halophila]